MVAYAAYYSFRLTVTDSGGVTQWDNVTVLVRPPPPLPPQEQALVVSPCIVDLGELGAATELRLDGAWDVADCNAHHRVDRPARYFRFTLSAETVVDIGLQSQQPAVLFVSKGTPQNGWGTPPAGEMEHRLTTRRNNGKLLHEEEPQATLTLGAGDYTVEAVSGTGQEGGTFSLTIAPP